MKKVLFVVASFFLFMNILNADCDYSKLVDLNTEASHVIYTYDFNDTSKRFDVTLKNITNNLKVLYNNKTYSATKQNVIIKGFEEGKYITINVNSNDSLCPNENLRVIYLTMPYVNPYYNSDECSNYTNLIVCSSKFLNYKLTYSNFKSVLNEYNENKTNTNEENQEEETNDKQTESIITIAYDLIKKYWLESSLLLGSFLISYILGNLIYKRVKYKL